MGMFTPDVKNLRELYQEKLEMALSSERQIVDKGLPAMIEKSTNSALKHAFEQHLQESKQHVLRLESMLDQLEGEENTTKCKVTATLISSAESAVSDAKNEAIRDVVLIASGNAVEHHEIAVYGTLRTWAEILGETDHESMLAKTLAEEKAADELLTSLSQQINIEAPVA